MQDDISSLIGDVANLLIQMPIPVCIFYGPDHIYAMTNAPYMAMVNHREVLGKSLREAWPEAAGQGFYELFDQMFATGEPFHIPLSQARIERNQPGVLEDTWFHLVYQPFRDRQGKVAGIIHIALDVTQQVQAQQENEQLNQELQLFKAMVDNATDAIVVSTTDGTVTYANDSFQSLFGYSKANILGNILTNFVPTETRAVATEAFQTVIEHGEWQGEVVYQRADQTTFYGASSGFLVHGKENYGYAAATFIRDMTRQREAEKALHSAVERNQLLFKNMSEGMAMHEIVFDDEGHPINYRILDINPSFERMLQVTRDMIVGKLATEAYGMETAPFLDTYARVAETGEPEQFETPFGSLVFDIRVMRPRKGEFVTMFSDITEQKRQQEEHQQVQEQIIEAQRSALRELSSPLIPIADKVVIMPLIGTIDSVRAQQVMETLLEGVAAYHAETAILDITGVQVVDTQVANALIQAAQAVQLLGAQVILTGIGPTMAQTLVHLGADLSSIITRGRLQAGIAYALG